ncbi:unnamed protein product [Gadus morhua 'NCC']
METLGKCIAAQRGLTRMRSSGGERDRRGRREVCIDEGPDTVRPNTVPAPGPRACSHSAGAGPLQISQGPRRLQ